jgi:hypothetical protein
MKKGLGAEKALALGAAGDVLAHGFYVVVISSSTLALSRSAPVGEELGAFYKRLTNLLCPPDGITLSAIWIIFNLMRLRRFRLSWEGKKSSNGQ